MDELLILLCLRNQLGNNAYTTDKYDVQEATVTLEVLIYGWIRSAIQLFHPS